MEANDDENDWVEAAMAFYEHCRFSKEAGVLICIGGQPGIDTGGARRQFFFVVLSSLDVTEKKRVIYQWRVDALKDKELREKYQEALN